MYNKFSRFKSGLKKGQVLSNFEVYTRRLPMSIDRSISQILRKKVYKKENKAIEHINLGKDFEYLCYRNECYFDEIGECDYTKTRFFREIFAKEQNRIEYTKSSHTCENCGCQMSQLEDRYFCKRCLKADLNATFRRNWHNTKEIDGFNKNLENAMRQYKRGIRSLLMSKSEEDWFRKQIPPEDFWDTI